MEDATNLSCPRCGILLASKGQLLIHLKSKTVCEPTVSDISRVDILKQHDRFNLNKTVECQHCKKPFSYKNYSRHSKICKNRPSSSIEKPPNQLIKDITEGDDEEVKISKSALTAIVSSVVSELMKKKNIFSNTTHITNITNNNSVNNNNIQINSFGNEDTSHLSHEFLSRCLCNPSKGLTNLIDTIHYSDDNPANRNIRFKSTKKNTFEKYLDNQWIECDASNTLDELIRKGYRVMNAHYTEFYMNDPAYDDDIKRMAIEKFRFLSDKTCNDYYGVKRDLRLLIKNKTVYVVAPPGNGGDGESVDEEQEAV